MNTEIQPINHPANRLGELIFIKANIGSIYKAKVGYYVWEADYARGYLFPTHAAGLISLGYRLGYDDDGFGKNKLGRCIEKHDNGEIWKVSDYQYYVWVYKTEDCYQPTSLMHAREHLGVNTENTKTTKTLPKSAYPQNQKGYSATK